MQRHIIDRPDYAPTSARLARFLALDHRPADKRIIARMRAQKGSSGPTRLAQYLRIARGIRA